MTRSAFLSRCLDLDKLLVEPLAEKRLRALVLAFGSPKDKIHDLRGLKLLDRLLRMCGIAIEAGLVPWEAGDAIVERFAADADPPRPLDRLFALSDFRQAAGHRKEDVEGVVAAALGRFDIDLAATKGGWGLPLDQIYDQLAGQLREIHATLIGVLRIPPAR